MQSSDTETHDREIATAMTAGTNDDAALLSSIEAKLSAVLEAGGEQTRLLSRLSTAIEDHGSLAEALAKSVLLNGETEAELKNALAAVAQSAEQHAHDRAGLIKEHLEAEAGRERAFELARESIEGLQSELNRTKRKYRAAQWEAERERKAHQATQAALATAEAKLRNFENSAVLRASVSLTTSMQKALSVTRLSRTSRRRRRKEQLQTILQSGLFDREWYLATYPDVASAGIDPLIHFFDLGWREGRDPGPNFATSAYLKANADVARSGANPLIHFVEFGRSEGREIRAHRDASEPLAAVKFDFPDPAPVYVGERGEDGAVRWLRSRQLQSDNPRLLSIAEEKIGYAEEPADREQIELAFARLASLSGLKTNVRRAVADPVETGSATLVDAWYLNELQLRTRWRDGDEPFVVHAFQYDLLRASQLKLVGEGLVASDLDFVDVTLANPYFPVLFVFAEPAGTLRRARLMAFPSLCRGGLHYAELLSSCPEAPDPLEAGVAQAVRLQEVRSSRNRLVKWIQIDPSGADGTSPLFQADFRLWLEKVVEAKIIETEGSPSRTMASLILASDMVPTIRILTESKGKTEASSDCLFFPLLIAGVEPSQPAMLVEMPPTAPAVLAKHPEGFAAAWPQLRANGPLKLPNRFEAAAIRLPRPRELGDAELTIPVAPGALPIPKDVSPVTWMIAAREWKPGEIVQTLHALSLQIGAEDHSIAFIDGADADSLLTARALFHGRVTTFDDAARAAKEAETPLIGHIGPGVILHDTRAAAVLTNLFSEPGIASATCPLIAAEKRGKGWHVFVVDAGNLATQLQASGPQVEQRMNWHSLWRSTYPISRPPRDFWIARATSVQDWLRPKPPQPLKKGMHICTSLITASYLSARSDIAEEVRVPAATEDAAMAARMLFG